LRWLQIALLAALLAGPLGGFVASAKTPTAAIPDTPVGRQLGWLLDALNNDGEGLTKSALKSHFSPDFLAALPADQLLDVLMHYVEPNAPLNVARFAGPTDQDDLHAILTTAKGDWSVVIGVEASGRRRINALFFEPIVMPAPAKPVKNWADLIERFKKLAPKTSLTIAELTGSGCAPIATLNPDAELAVGSSFKLYVAGELARQIEAGKLRWDQLVTIRDDLRSLPNGDLRLAAAGSQYTLRYVFEQMISQSDNTATDHLIPLLGRTNVEAMMATMGHADPTLNTPLLLTREWFAIKLRWSHKQIAAYLTSQPAEKRAMLAQADADAATLGQDEEWLNPYLIDSIEWFASSADLCRSMAYLHGQMGKPDLAELKDAFSIYEGISFDASTWRYVGFKGGYETGVKSDVWLLERADGRWFVVSGIINDPKQEIDGDAMHQLLSAVVGLLAKT
jgi:beta-lactamase class A